MCAVPLPLSPQPSPFLNKLLEKVAHVSGCHIAACANGDLYNPRWGTEEVASNCRVSWTFSHIFCKSSVQSSLKEIKLQTLTPTWIKILHIHQIIHSVKHGLVSFMWDGHLRPESAAAGLVLANDGQGRLTGQKPIQHWLPANYRRKEVAACLFLGCRGIYLHFTKSSWAIECEFRWAVSAMSPISFYLGLARSLHSPFPHLIPPPSVFTASVGGASWSPLSHPVLRFE